MRAVSSAAAAFPPGRWRARWIWCEPPRLTFDGGRPTLARGTGARLACFRRRIALETVPPVAPARMVSDGRHVVWVNGREVARGPVRSDPRRLAYDHVDLAPHLVEGTNVIAVLVCFYGEANAWWMPAPATYGLGAGAFAFEARLGDGWLASDAEWRTLAPTTWTMRRPAGIGGTPLEVCDARGLPAGWHVTGFDDAAWSAAAELSATHIGTGGDPRPPTYPFGALAPRPIPQLGGPERPARVVQVRRVAGAATDEDPVLQVDTDDASASGPAETPAAWPLRLEAADGVALVTVDFGEETCGTLRLDLDAPAGARIDVAVAEAVSTVGRLERLGQHSGFRYVARGTDDRFETLDPVGVRVARLAVRSPGGPVVLRAVTLKERLCPRPAGAEFACSDPGLERIWQVGRRTVDCCSLDAYVDCPSREQRAWTGDGVVHQMVDLATNPDWRLARRYVELAATPRPDGMLPMAVASDFAAADATIIPDWALHWVRGLWNLWRWTGDRDLVARHLGPAEGVLRWFVPYQGVEGLLGDVTGWLIADWAAVGTRGTSAVVNALWARALRDFAEMATWLGDAGRARWAEAEWERVRDAFECFWDARRGLYVDEIVGGRPGRAVSQHANAAAVAAGLVPPERMPEVMAAILDPARLVRATWLLPGRTSPPEDGDMYAGAGYLVAGPPEPWWDVEREIVAAQPFFRYVVHDAVAAAGMTGRIAALCRDWEALLPRSPTTWSETWHGGSRCHGWSSTPTRDLVVYTLGVTPAVPGYDVARVAPALGALAWARGRVPTPHGMVEVAVDRERVEVTSPVPVEVTASGATVAHPAGRHIVRRA